MSTIILMAKIVARSYFIFTTSEILTLAIARSEASLLGHFLVQSIFLGLGFKKDLNPPAICLLPLHNF